LGVSSRGAVNLSLFEVWFCAAPVTCTVGMDCSGMSFSAACAAYGSARLASTANAVGACLRLLMNNKNENDSY
jgi:hypothetical protein